MDDESLNTVARLHGLTSHLAPFLGSRPRAEGGLRLSRPMCGRAVPGCALPARVDGTRGYAPTQGRSPGMIRVLPPVGRSRHRTSGGTAENWSFHTVSVATGCDMHMQGMMFTGDSWNMNGSS